MRRLIATFDANATDERCIRHCIEQDEARSGSKHDLTVIHTAYGKAAGVHVIGLPQAVMFAIGAVAAQGFNSLVKVE